MVVLINSMCINEYNGIYKDFHRDIINSMCINEYNGIYKDFHRVLRIYLSK